MYGVKRLLPEHHPRLRIVLSLAGVPPWQACPLGNSRAAHDGAVGSVAFLDSGVPLTRVYQRPRGFTLVHEIRGVVSQHGPREGTVVVDLDGASVQSFLDGHEGFPLPSERQFVVEASCASLAVLTDGEYWASYAAFYGFEGMSYEAWDAHSDDELEALYDELEDAWFADHSSYHPRYGKPEPNEISVL